MRTADFDVLLERVKNGERLTSSELAPVRRALERSEPAADPYTLLHILGKAEDRSAIHLIWRYTKVGLDDPSDDGMLRRIAVQVLAQWWTMKEALPLVADSAFHDPSPMVRMVAASGLGYIGRKWPEVRGECAGLLLQGFEQGRDEEEPELWEAFYFGMLELCEVPPWTRPHPVGLRLADVDLAIVNRVGVLKDAR